MIGDQSFTTNNDLMNKSSLLGLQEQKPITVSSIFKKAGLKCVSGCKGIQFCVSCGNPESVFCGQENCVCMSTHQDCNMRQIKSIEKFIRKKVIHSQISTKIKEMVNKMIDQISLLEEKLVTHFDQFFGLCQIDKDFLEKVKHYNSDKNISGQSIVEYEKLSQQCCQKFLLKEMNSQFDLLKKSQKQLNQKCQDINEVILQQYLSIIKTKKFVDESAILPKCEDKQKLLNYFNHIPRPVVSFMRIYSANNDGWTSQVFNQKCQNKSNLLYLVENEFGKKYGGYSPCQLSVNRRDKWETDESLTSFIFSLDDGLKAKVVDPKKAIKNSFKNESGQSWFILFGLLTNCNLLISELSNEDKKDNWIGFSGGAYQNKSWNKLDICDTNQSKCKLKQFQVFQITFDICQNSDNQVNNE